MNVDELKKKVNEREYTYDYEYKKSDQEIKLVIAEQLDQMNKHLETLIGLLKEGL